VRQVDDAAERKDQRQPERDQEVDRAEEQAVDHLLHDENDLHRRASVAETSQLYSGRPKADPGSRAAEGALS